MKSFREYLIEAEKADEKGTYASLGVDVNSRKKLYKWLEKQKIENLIDIAEYHCTIVYSTKAVPEVENIDVNFPIKAKPKEWKVFGTDNLLVLVVDNPEIVELFKKTRKMGAESDYPSFVPHISVAKNYKGDVPDALPKFLITFNSFKVGTIDEDFTYNAE
jgi:hypothetical protein